MKEQCIYCKYCKKCNLKQFLINSIYSCDQFEDGKSLNYSIYKKKWFKFFFDNNFDVKFANENEAIFVDDNNLINVSVYFGIKDNNKFGQISVFKLSSFNASEIEITKQPIFVKKFDLTENLTDMYFYLTSLYKELKKD